MTSLACLPLPGLFLTLPDQEPGEPASILVRAARDRCAVGSPTIRVVRLNILVWRGRAVAYAPALRLSGCGEPLRDYPESRNRTQRFRVAWSTARPRSRNSSSMSR